MTDAIESELFSLVMKLDLADQPASALLAVRSQRLAQLCDRLFQVRSAKLLNAIPEKEKLDRVKLQEKQTAATKQAHRELAQRLQQPDVKLDNLMPWVQAEILYHRIKAHDDLVSIAEPTWTAYEAIPVVKNKLTGDMIKTKEELDQLYLDAQYESLRDRHLTVLTYLAAQRAPNEPGGAQKLKTFLAARLKSEPTSDYWKQAWQRLLIALDQPKELEASLKEWMLAAGSDQRYRLMLAYLQAERGGLQEAVDLIEKVKTDDELAPADWRALSDWLLVLNQQARHQQSRVQQYAASSEQALYGYLQVQQSQVTRQGQGVPGKLDDDTFVVIPELFRKTQSPGNYFPIVQALYEATKDFRLLAGLADGTLGHTPGQVYDMLQKWRGLIGALQEEATLDELSKRIVELRKTANSSLDHRAIDLLEAFLHRKAATQINQPDVHARLAIECLHRAMQHDWQPEEPVALGKLFYHLQQEDHAAWKEEVRAVFNKLIELTLPGSLERVEVSYYYVAYHPQPFEFLQKAIEEAQQAVRRVAARVQPTHRRGLARHECRPRSSHRSLCPAGTETPRLLTGIP